MIRATAPHLFAWMAGILIGTVTNSWMYGGATTAGLEAIVLAIQIY